MTSGWRETIAAAALSLLCAANVALAQPGGLVTPSPHAQRVEAVGLWRVPVARRGVRVGPNAVAMPFETRFAYDGESVVLYLWWMHSEMPGRSEDDHYRVPTHWSGDVLEYEVVPGRWQPFARFVQGRFEWENGGATYVYERVTRAADLDAQDRILLRPRQLLGAPRSP